MKRSCFIIIPLLLLFLQCDWNPFTEDADSTASGMYIIVTTSDYTHGNVTSIAVDDNFTPSRDRLSISSDNVVFCHDEAIYILERSTADNIIRIDGPSLSAANVTYQQAKEASANMHAIAVVSSSKAYVTQFGSDHIAVINPADGKTTGTIALDDSPYLHEGEDVPNMSSMSIVDGKAYIVLQRLKTFQGQSGPYMGVGDSTGMIVVIDTESDGIIKNIPLEKSNPAALAAFNGNLYVVSSGSWGDPEDGGIEKIDCVNDCNEGVVLEESDFGGDISTLVMISESKAYVAVGMYDEEFNFSTVVREFDPSAGSVGGTISSVNDAFGGMAYDGTYLYIGDRSVTDPGVVVIDPSDNSKVAGPIDVGSLPPSALAVLKVEK